MKGKLIKFLLFIVVMSPTWLLGQLEVGASYRHLTGNSGLDGFNASVGYQFSRRVTLVGEGDFLFDSSRVGVFDLAPNVGAVRIKSNLQNYLGGARVRIVGWKPLKKLEKKKFLPFGEVLFGASRLSQSVKDSQGSLELSAADKAFTWVLGGGLDYTLSARWVARVNADLVRTHFVDEGQSRLRVGLGLAYSF